MKKAISGCITRLEDGSQTFKECKNMSHADRSKYLKLQSLKMAERRFG